MANRTRSSAVDRKLPAGAEKSALACYQYAFAAALRAPILDELQQRALDRSLSELQSGSVPVDSSAGAQVIPERLQVYRELLFHNVSSFIDNAFPVLISVLGPEQSEPLKRQFFAEYSALSPYFQDISRSFLDFLDGAPELLSDLPPFVLELAQYEWLELALEVATETIDEVQIQPARDWLQQVPVRSPLAVAVQYRYPVHRIGPDFLPEAPDPTWLLVYRDRDDQVGFMQINRATHLLLDALGQHPRRTGAEQLQALAEELGLPVASLLDFGPGLLDQLAARDVVLGVDPGWELEEA